MTPLPHWLTTTKGSLGSSLAASRSMAEGEKLSTSDFSTTRKDLVSVTCRVSVEWIPTWKYCHVYFPARHAPL